MIEAPTKYTIPPALRAELLRIALEIDVVAEFRGIETWRIAAASAARWLLRCAAEYNDMPRQMGSTLRHVAGLTRRMSSNQDEEYGSGEMTQELEKFLEEEED